MLPYLVVRDQDEGATLIQFDLSGMPSDTVLDASVSFWVSSKTGLTPVTVAAHQVIRPWTELHSSWEYASDGDLWDLGGCNSILDRNLTPTGSTSVQSSGEWFSVDVTSAVLAWQQGQANYGLVLKATTHEDSQIVLASREFADVTKRPRLTVTTGIPTAMPN
jgi:hypothetical protein